MSSEKSLLLPVTERPPRNASRAPALGLSSTAWVRVAEAILLPLSLLLAVVQFGAIYTFYYTSQPAQSPFLPAFVRSPTLLALARGLPLAITSNLVTSIAFFVAAPYIAKEGAVGLARGLTVFCYLAGSTWGAVLLGADLQTADFRYRA